MSSNIKKIMTIATLAITSAVFAAPPDWAPAHGWRNKNDPQYSGYQGKTKEWKEDYGVSSGTCQTQNVAQVLGASAGAVIGGAVAKNSNTTAQIIATIGGAAVGAILGQEIAKTFNMTDAACFGQAMELAPNGTPVIWSQNNIQYNVRPISNVMYGTKECRKVEISSLNNAGNYRDEDEDSDRKGKHKKNKKDKKDKYGYQNTKTVIACPTGVGTWTLS